MEYLESPISMDWGMEDEHVNINSNVGKVFREENSEQSHYADLQ